MAYIYHGVPEHMEGTTLYPLSVLADLHNDIFKTHQQKYAKRPRVLINAIPRLGCFWNDVLHFTAVKPQELKEALVRAGVERTLRFVEVDPVLLSGESTIVFLNKTKEGREGVGNLDDFVDFDPYQVEQYGNIPQENEAYYRENADKGDEFLLFHNIPHILYKGSFDIKGFPIITL
jgi:hypothetical protein